MTKCGKALTSSTDIFAFLQMSVTLGGLIPVFIASSFFMRSALVCWRINAITFLFHERAVNESEGQSPLCFVNHWRTNECVTLRALQVWHFGFATNLWLQKRKLLWLKDSVEIHPEQSAMSIFLIEDEMLIALATKKIKKMWVAPTDIHILDLFCSKCNQHLVL